MTRLAELRRAADCCRDVVAHAREGIAAAGPGFILVVAGDEVGADVDRQVRGWHFEVIRLAERTRSTHPPGPPDIPRSLSETSLHRARGRLLRVEGLEIENQRTGPLDSGIALDGTGMPTLRG
jgi:hypothetical protein